MSRFLLVTWEGGGVVPPELGVARRLVARGHSVRVLADPSVETAARAAGCAFRPYATAPSRASLRPEHEVVRGWEAKSPVQEFRGFLDGVMCGPADRYAADTLAELDREPADAVLVDMNLLGGLVAAQARGLPHVVLVPNIYLRPAPGIPPVGPGLMPATSFLGEWRDALLGWVSGRLWRTGLPALNRACAALGVAPVEDLFALYDRADEVLVLTAVAFDFPARALPSNVHYVGPVLDDPAWVGDEPALSWPLEGGDPLVLVSLSSTYQDQAAAIQRVVDALAGQPLRALVTLGPALAPDAVRSSAPNVACVPVFPHARVLPHARAVVTHAGHGTVIKALGHGVPLVCLPMGRDQMDNAARVVARGAGLRVAPTAAPNEIRTAVSRVLTEEAFREAARRLGDAIAAPGADPSARIEAVATRGQRRCA